MEGVRKKHWKLLRLSTDFLKQNAPKWRTSRIEECARIKELEKEDRLSIVKEKKKRYRLKRLSKEENLRLKMRTEERIEFWKWYREDGRVQRTGDQIGKKEEERRELWNRLKARIMAL